MGITNISTEANDYAVALCLNERVWKILWHVADLYPLQSKDMDKVNRNYILLVQELSEIYANNNELQQLEPKPAWQRFKQIETNQVAIADLQDDRTGDTGQAHTAEVKRLCIIKNKEMPDLNVRQKKLTSEADEIIAVLYKHAEDERKHLRVLQQQKLEQHAPENATDSQSMQTEGGQIAKLSLIQKTLKVNIDGITYSLKRFDSTKRFNYNLAKYLLGRPDEWVKKEDLGSKFKTIGSKAKDWPKLLGFTGEMKDIFISFNSKEQTIMLNPQKSLTPDEAAIIKAFVKTKKPQ
jgi:hypothetical protein